MAAPVGKRMPRPRFREFGDQLEELLEARSLYKRDIARELDVSSSYLSQVVKRGGTPDQIDDISRALRQLGVKVEGEPIKPTYFDIYSARKIVDEALHGDELAIDLLNLYARYFQAPGRTQKEIRQWVAASREVI